MKRILLTITLIVGAGLKASNEPVVRPITQPKTMPYVGTPYVIRGEVLPQPNERQQDPQEIPKVMEYRNFLLKKAGYDSKIEKLTPEERDYLDRALKVYPVWEI